ncbi:E2/UBC family protein [Bythopirellula polymerisocia]|uniref:Ubiquitin-conjugating enzyme n=1 Tax=Bythopirellula polymerisocia TaxID=2528003 RepID=A0A5C6C9D9_9BACT|nr:E2/UBC family protein [Bythopirellula polymerisocia]TWU20725.1 hypothetical protein Pla144_48920 [Bythopirellula polymerisocia]
MSTLEHDLRNLSCAGFSLWVDERRRFVIVEHVQLPLGYDRHWIPVLIELPRSYPMVPPGVGGNRVYIPKGMRFLGSLLQDVHPACTPNFITPGWRDWAWLCYEKIDWNPLRDDLITFIELIRANLTNPTTF